MKSANFWPVLYRDLLAPFRQTIGFRTNLIFYGPFTVLLVPGQSFSNTILHFHNHRGSRYYNMKLPECHFQWTEEELRLK